MSNCTIGGTPKHERQHQAHSKTAYRARYCLLVSVVKPNGCSWLLRKASSSATAANANVNMLSPATSAACSTEGQQGRYATQQHATLGFNLNTRDSLHLSAACVDYHL